MKKFIAVVALMLAPISANASGSSSAAYQSNSGESMDEFVVRSARAIELIGLRANAEVCGAITSSDGIYHLTISTKLSNIQCTVEHDANATLIHTHLPYMGARFSPADYSHRGYMIRNGVICYNEGERGTEVTVTKYGRRNSSTCADQ